MLYEVKKMHICINKIEETTMLCYKTAIAIRTDRGIHILDIPYNLRRYDKTLDYMETLITPSKHSPTSELFKGNFLKYCVRNSEFIQMILDPTLWPHNDQLSEMINIANFKWSPFGFIGNIESSMAILTNVGGIELFGPIRLKWTSILNISSLIKDNLNRLSLIDPHKVPKSSKEIQEIAHILATIAICWPDKMNEDRSCYFVTVQKCGLILFWLLKFVNLQVTGEVVGYIQVDNIEINDIIWVPIKNNYFLITISNILGKVYTYECVIEENSIKSLSKHELWTHSDRMIAKHFNYIIYDESIIILYSKHRHFIVQMLDKYYTLKSQEVININDYKITDIKKHKTSFYLATVNNRLYKVDIQDSSSVLKVLTSLVEIKESYPTAELHALGFSTNGVSCTLALIDRKVLCRKEPIKIDLNFLRNDDDKESEISALLNNQTKSLANYWDYIEMLRYTITKTKNLPDLDYNGLFEEGDIDIYKLKVYYILLIIYNNLEKVCKNSSVSLPETSLELVQDKIHACYASSLVTKLYYKHDNISDLNNLDSETICNAKTYLEYYCNKYKKDLSSKVDPNILKMKTEFKYTCQCCDKQLNNLKCEDGHLNMLCSLTFTPIEGNDYLICKACGAIARYELKLDKPMCVFCDLYLSESIAT